MKILITGAGGFVGQALAAALLNAGHTLVLADLHEPAVPPAAAAHAANATLVAADLHDDPGAALTPDLDALYVLHGIMSAGSEENLELGYRANLHATLNLLEAVRRTCRAGVRFIYTSSCAVYGQPLPQAPDAPSEATVPTPQGSYGTQKAMVELAVNDYTRRGCITGFSLRLPTISVRPGAPSAAASSWMSGIVREPLQGKPSSLPCDDDFECWLCSPRTLIRNMVVALTLPRDCVPSHVRQILLPGITATVKEMLQALREVGGDEAVALVKREEASPQVKAILESWAVRYDVSKALAIGFEPDQSFKGAVQDFADSLKK